MNRKIVGLAAVVALLIATPLMAQGRRGGGGGGGISKLQLAQAEQVQKELELVADQKEQIAKLAEDARAARRGGGGAGNFQDLSDEERAKLRQEQMAHTRETDKKVEAVLVGPQKTRLNEIYIQAAGTAALSNEDVAKELGIGADLQEKIRTTRQEAQAASRQGGGGGGGFNPEAFAKARAEVESKVLALLSAEQKEKFEKMKGKKVDYDLTAIGRGGRRGGGGNQ